MVKRGDVWLAALDPTVGREIRKTRPCVVVSPDELNAHLDTAIVAPMTTGSRPAPFRVPLTFKGKAGLILPDQMRTLDTARLVKRLGRLDAPTLRALLAVLGEMFAD
jgi:mRNA interferase MazF